MAILKALEVNLLPKGLRNLGGQEFIDKLLVVQDIELRLMKGEELKNF